MNATHGYLKRTRNEPPRYFLRFAFSFVTSKTRVIPTFSRTCSSNILRLIFVISSDISSHILRNSRMSLLTFSNVISDVFFDIYFVYFSINLSNNLRIKDVYFDSFVNRRIRLFRIISSKQSSFVIPSGNCFAIKVFILVLIDFVKRNEFIVLVKHFSQSGSETYFTMVCTEFHNPIFSQVVFRYCRQNVKFRMLFGNLQMNIRKRLLNYPDYFCTVCFGVFECVKL